MDDIQFQSFLAVQWSVLSCLTLHHNGLLLLLFICTVSGGCYALPIWHRTGNAVQKFVKYIKTESLIKT